MTGTVMLYQSKSLKRFVLLMFSHRIKIKLNVKGFMYVQGLSLTTTIRYINNHD